MSSSDDETTINLKPLEDLVKTLKAPIPKTRVGVLAGKSARDGAGANNAEIGAAHEYGTEKIPMRSFLRIPLAEHLSERIEKNPMLNDEILQECIGSRDLTPFMKVVAAMAEGVVLEAFDTNGFGKWVALNPKTLQRKKVKQTLVETQQLRDSITSEVKSG